MVNIALMLGSVEICELFKINSYARIDFRVNKSGVPFVIDINPNPCLSCDAGFVAAAQQFNLSFDQIITNILNNIYE